MNTSKVYQEEKYFCRWCGIMFKSNKRAEDCYNEDFFYYNREHGLAQIGDEYFCHVNHVGYLAGRIFLMKGDLKTREYLLDFADGSRRWMRWDNCHRANGRVDWWDGARYKNCN